MYAVTQKVLCVGYSCRVGYHKVKPWTIKLSTIKKITQGEHFEPPPDIYFGCK